MFRLWDAFSCYIDIVEYKVWFHIQRMIRIRTSFKGKSNGFKCSAVVFAFLFHKERNGTYEGWLKMREQWRLAAEKYIETGNQKEAALAAGYSESYAEKKAWQLFQRQEVKDYIEELHEKMEQTAIAKPAEIMKYWTSVMRGEAESEVLVVEGSGGGCSEARIITKRPSENEKLKASAQLAKRYGIDRPEDRAEKDVMDKLDEILGGIDAVADE